MQERVAPAVRELDETIALCGVEPFHRRLDRRGLRLARQTPAETASNARSANLQLLNLTHHNDHPP